MIECKEDLLHAVERFGILPYFANSVPGWSVEELCDPALWFSDAEGPWEWKGQMARDRLTAYGRFVRKKNAWVSLDCFPHLMNYRRDGYDFEGMCEDGLIPHEDRLFMEFLTARLPMRSRDARRLGPLKKGYDTALARLQMQTFLTNQDFVYSIDREGRPMPCLQPLKPSTDRTL